MKQCNKCDGLKDESDFYAKQHVCKECIKARVRENRAENLEYYQDYDRKRANQLNRVKARAEYAKTTKGRLKTIAAKQAWAERNPEKRKAHYATGNAIRDGNLIKQPCEVCSTTEDIEAHHDDYTKPLEVRWLCTKHHAEHHKNEREELRQAS